MSLEEALEKRSLRIKKIAGECAEVFARSKHITLEIGCGKGHYLSAYAAAFPQETCVGIDLISERVRDSQRRAKNRDAANAFFFKAEASEFLEALPRGLMQTAFLDYLRQFAHAGSRLYFRTDHEEYFEATRAVVEENSNWQLLPDNALPFEEVSQFQRILKTYQTLAAEAK